MALVQSFYNQSSELSISVMIVDDDPIFLQVMSRMLEKSKYIDPSLMEIIIIAVKGPMEALSTLKVQRKRVDLIVTDYYMPVMNGVQLKSEITREFGNLPFIVMSSDPNKEQESLTCGALCFIAKPIKATDLTKIYQLALTCKNENNHKKKDVNIPKQIQLKNCLSRSDSISLNITNETCVSIDDSQKSLKRKPHNGFGDDDVSKKKKISWTDFLNDRFYQAIMHIGIEKAVPKNILEFMNIPYLTREQVASHLQKYRIFLKKVAEESVNHTSNNNNFKPTNCWYDKSLNDRSFYYKPIQGFGQSRLLSKTGTELKQVKAPHTLGPVLCKSVHVKKIPYNYVNRSPTNEPHIGSNLTLPMKNKLNFSNQHEPPMMANKISQTSQVLGFGQHGLPTINDLPLRSSSGSSTLNQPRLSSYRSSSLNQPRLSSYGSLTPNQPELSSYRTSTPNQPELNGYGSSTLNRPELSNYGSSLTSNQPGLNDYYGSPTLYQPRHDIFGSSSTPNLEIPQLENLNLYDELYKPDEFPCNISNFHFDQNKQQGEAGSTTKFDLPTNFSTELDQIFSLEADNDLTFMNMNQDHSNREMTNNFAAREKNSIIFNMNPNHYQNQDHLNKEMSNIFAPPEKNSTILNMNPNHNQDHSNKEMLNIFAAPEKNSTIFNMNSNHNYNQDHSNREMLNIFAAPEKNSTIFNMNSNHNHNQDHSKREMLNICAAPEKNSTIFNMNSNHNYNQDHSNKEMSNIFADPEKNSTIFNMNPNHNYNQDHSNREMSNIFAAPEKNSTIFNMNPNHNCNQDHSNREMSNIFAAPEKNSTIFNMNPNHNYNQDHSNREMLNIFAAPEKNSTIFNMNPNQNNNQEHDFIDWSLFDSQNSVDDVFTDLLNNSMNRKGFLEDVLQTNLKK